MNTALKHCRLLILTVLLGLSLCAQAQEDAEFKPEVAPKEQSTTLLSLIKAGGLTMVPLGAFSIAIMSLVVRSFMILKEEKLLPPDVVSQLMQQLSTQDIHAATETCNDNPTLITTVIGSGLERINAEEVDPDVIKEAIEESGTEQMLYYMGPVSYLSIIGAVAPMLGLLGTVSGMIKAFQNIAAGGMGKADVLAANIGEALVTTATGLIIAIPAMLFYFYFKNKFMRIMAKASQVSGTLLDALRTGVIPPRFSSPIQDQG
jgi:biopolymer transport protein ExbB